MTIIYSLNNIVMVHEILCVKWNINFMFIYQNSNFIFIKKSITSLSKIKFYLYKKSNDISNKISNIISIKNQILYLTKIKIYLYEKSNFIFIKILFDFYN